MKKLNHLPEERGYLLFFIAALLFALMTAVFQPALAVIQGLMALVLFLSLRGLAMKRNAAFLDYMKSRENDIDAATRGTIVNAPLPMVIFQPETEEIIWSNHRFIKMTGNPEHLFDTKLSEVMPNVSFRWLVEGKFQAPEPVILRGGQYLVYGNLIEGNLAVTYWVEITRYVHLEETYLQNRPVAAVLLLDNYDDLMRGIGDSERSVLASELNKRINQWAEQTEGIVLHYDREEYFLLFEEKQLPQLQKQRFSVLETVREVRSPNQITATLSVGIGRDADTLKELFKAANLSMEMALSRGGDQVVIKDRENYQFIGGKSKETERRTKVKSRVVANALSELLSNAKRVLIMGHRHADLDVVGAAAGLVAIARKRRIPAYLILEEDAPAKEMMDQLRALPAYETVFQDKEAAVGLVDQDTLLIVVDTNRPEQVQMPELLKAAGRVVIIDHHRRANTYIENATLNFEDPYTSSASELVTELMQHILEPADLLRQEAAAVLAGIVLDTKNFTIRTGGRTFESAAYLRKVGADTVEVRKLFQSDMKSSMARFDIMRRASLYRNGISIAVTEESVGRITAAQAADELVAIADVEAAFVLCQGEESILLSARSVGSVNVQVVTEMLGGGGNAASAGAQLKGITLEAATLRLKDAIDRYFEE